MSIIYIHFYYTEEFILHIEQIFLQNDNHEIEKFVLSNLKKYTKLKEFNCNRNLLKKLPDLPNSLIELYCHHNNLTELPYLPNSLHTLYCNHNKLTYPNLEIKTVNETNLKNKILKRMKLLNRTLLLEHSTMITMNPKRIKRLLDNQEIDFYDGSFVKVSKKPS